MCLLIEGYRKGLGLLLAFLFFQADKDQCMTQKKITLIFATFLHLPFFSDTGEIFPAAAFLFRIKMRRGSKTSGRKSLGTLLTVFLEKVVLIRC